MSTMSLAAVQPERIEIGPQPGFQRKFLASPADIVVGGGAAGAGKSYALALAPARYMDVPGFAATFFRRSLVEIKNQGGLWDESEKIYPLLGADPNLSSLEWEWGSGARVKMGHLEYENTKYDWKGAQLAMILFDELTSFTESQFFYLLSRNRTTCGVRPQVKATCNPDADSWVAKLLEWWIDQVEFLPNGDPNPGYGLPIEARSGVVRYFSRVSDKLVWADSREDLAAEPAVLVLIEAIRKARPKVTFLEARDIVIKSLTFVPGRLEENVILEEGNPGYRGNLLLQTRVEQARLLGGNWKVKAEAGTYFQKHEVTMVDFPPDDIVDEIRRWDLAASEPTTTYPDPDWTVGVRMGKRKNGRFVISDAIMVRKREGQVQDLVLRTANNDGKIVKVGLPQDPGQAGKGQVENYVKLLAGFNVVTEKEKGNKETRCKALAASWQHRNVDVVRGPWNDLYFSQMEAFPTKGVHDDAPDASSGAFKELTGGYRSVLEARW